MSLDIALLGADGAPSKSIALDPDLHFELMSLSSKHHLHLMLRLKEYYEDVEVTPELLPELAIEVDVLSEFVDRDSQKKFLTQFRELISRAIQEQVSLHSIAD